METKQIKISITTFFRISLYLVGIFASLILFAATTMSQYRGMIKDAQFNLENNARFVANSVSKTLEFYKNQTSVTGHMPAFSEEGTNSEIKQQILKNMTGTYEFNRADILDDNGYSMSSGKFVGDRDFFIQAQNGNVFITVPVEETNRAENIQNIIISVPIWKNQENPQTIGAIYFELASKTIYDSVIFAKANPQARFAIFDRYFTPLMAEGGQLSEAQEIMGAVKKNGQASFIEKKGLKGNSAIFARSTIENTDGWQIVIYTPTASILKGFHKMVQARIYSLLILIIITELTVSIINRKVCKPIIQTCQQLEKAANGNLTSLSLEETFVAEADRIEKSASKLIDKLNISIALEEDFGNSSTLSDLISTSVLKTILSFYKTSQYEGLNLILSESNGAFLMDSSPISGNIAPLRSDLPPIKSIKVESRIIGTIEFQLAENSRVNEIEARQIIASIGEQLSLFAESNYRHSLYHKSQVAKLQRSLGGLARANTKILNVLNPLIARFSETPSEEFLSMSPLKLEKEKIGVISSLRQITGQIDRAVETSVRSELVSSLTEAPYTIEELVSSVKKIELPELPHTKYTINVQASPVLPKALFGDIKYITRLIMWNEEIILKNGETNAVSVNIDASKGTYNCNLQITLKNSITRFSVQYMQRIKAYLNGDFMAFGETENLSNVSWRLISIIRIVKMHNGKIEINQDEQNGVKIEIMLPQVEVSKE